MDADQDVKRIADALNSGLAKALAIVGSAGLAAASWNLKTTFEIAQNVSALSSKVDGLAGVMEDRTGRLDSIVKTLIDTESRQRANLSSLRQELEDHIKQDGETTRPGWP